jgi:hypothetical protein
LAGRACRNLKGCCRRIYKTKWCEIADMKLSVTGRYTLKKTGTSKTIRLHYLTPLRLNCKQRQVVQYKRRWQTLTE